MGMTARWRDGVLQETHTEQGEGILRPEVCQPCTPSIQGTKSKYRGHLSERGDYIYLGTLLKVFLPGKGSSGRPPVSRARIETIQGEKVAGTEGAPSQEVVHEFCVRALSLDTVPLDVECAPTKNTHEKTGPLGYGL